MFTARKPLAIAMLAASAFFAGTGCKKKEQPIPVTPKTDVVPQPFLGTWPAVSTTAMGVTGDVTLGSTTMRIGDRVVVVNGAHALDAAETTALGSLNTIPGTPTAGFIANVPIPTASTMLGGNTLCGARDANWIAGVTNGNGQLGLAVFAGSARPVFTTGSLSSSHELCGTFGYSK